MALNDARGVNWSILAAARFFLAFVVMNVHLAEFDRNPWTEFFASFGGKTAVLGFLVISGYSVTSSFDRNPHKFLQRRLLRIYPAYLVSIVCAVLLQLSLKHYQAGYLTFQPSGFWEITGNLLLVQMYLCKAISFNPVVWSLSLEFSYYIYLRFFGDVRWLVGAALFISLLYVFVLREVFQNNGLMMLSKLNMVSNIWPFIIGIYLYRYMSWLMLLVAGIGGAVLVYGHEPLASWTFVITIASIAIAALGNTQSRPILNILGDLSYPLYLMHVPVTLALFGLLGFRSAGLAAAASLAISAMVLRLVEHPFNRLMKQLGSVRTDKIALAAPTAGIQSADAA